MLLVAALRSSGGPASVRLGLRAGIIMLLVGCAIGFIMVFNNSGVYQGSIGPASPEQTAGYLGPDAATVGPEYLLLRPSTDGGDLVLLHAIGVHGLVLLAVPATLLARTQITADRQLRVVAVASVAVAMVLLLVQAFRQLPLDQLRPVALVVLAGCAVALLAAYARIVVALRLSGRTQNRSQSPYDVPQE